MTSDSVLAVIATSEWTHEYRVLVYLFIKASINAFPFALIAVYNDVQT
jgi:hypothetical protein